MRAITFRSAVLALALALAGAGASAAAQGKTAKKIQITPTKALDGAKVIALQVWAENLTAGTEARYGIAPTNEAIPVRLGDRVRVRLVGTAIEADGDGVEVPILARFAEAPGTRMLDIRERGSNWVVVDVHSRDLGRNDGRAQLAYEVTGRYDLRPAMTEGRITFDLGTRGAGAPITTFPGGVSDRDRHRRAEELATVLYDGILRVEPRAAQLVSTFDTDADTIYRLGYQGVVQVALNRAAEAERRDIYRGASSTEVVGHLYRVLLGRNGSDQQIWNSDAGFADNVRRYEREGLESVVATIVRSEEFQRVHNVAGL
jgi:hypothetical protein